MRIVRYKTMAALEFPPKAIRAIVKDVASLLKERKETVSVAETVRVTIFYYISNNDFTCEWARVTHRYARRLPGALSRLRF
jgi:hypothetical protein